MIYGFYTQVPIEHLGVVLFEGKKKKTHPESVWEDLPWFQAHFETIALNR